MAILSSTDLAKCRNDVTSDSSISINFTKIQANAVSQAIEDWWITNAVSLSTAINTATAPLILSVAQKKAFGKAWLLNKFNRGG